ncbi:hypothetical protein ALC62_01080 [Cyphomyrmex costatus]|uniref:Uncharacterized protein n=1 Tax=Cyphomyrmex costatus TaxID=456900 RepID=A0A195D4T7_9HYME|nr:hypothetical protein ALC62_01080 [Cyphomyrmex costatus]
MNADVTRFERQITFGVQHCVKRMKDGAIIFQFPARNFSDNIDFVLNADFTSGLERTKEPQTVTRKRNVPLHRKHWRTTDIRAFDTGSSRLCVRVCSGERNGSVHPTSADGNGVAHTDTMDKLKKFYRIGYPYLNVIDLNSELAVNCNCTFGHITVQFGDTVVIPRAPEAYLQLVRNLDDSSLDPYLPGTCTIRDQLLELPLYEDTTSDTQVYLYKKYGDFPIEEIQFKIPKLQQPPELIQDSAWSPLKAFTFVNVFTRKEGNIERARSDRLLSRNELPSVPLRKPVFGFGITGVGDIDRRETGK